MADFYTYRNEYAKSRRRRRLVVVVLVLLAAVCVAAGLYWQHGGKAPQAAPEATAEPTPAPEASAAPTPSPTPTPAAGEEPQRIVQAVDTAVELNRRGDYGVPVLDYVDENVSTKVVRLIQSYTGVVNKMVWRKF